ncbi:MAG: tetratricopeptide repeat protein [Paraprevotella sp.]|nr:tetratricopeptide repeat protein [Paraprevotella sp.]
MDADTYSTLYRDAREALLQRKVSDALTCIRAMLYLDTPAPDTAELDNLQTDYRLLLDFMSRGGNDPQRREIHRRIILRAFALLEQIYRSSLLKYGNGMIAPLLRQMQNDPLRNHPATLVAEASVRLVEIAQSTGNSMPGTGERELESEREEWHIRLFNAFATGEFLHTDEMQALAKGLERLPVTAGELTLSALFLSLWTCFDANKATVLLQLCESEIPELRVRALTGLVWTCIGHSRQLTLHKELLKGISLLKDNPTVRHELTLIQKQWYISLEAVRADKKMKEDILPDLLGSKHFQRTRMGFEEVDADLMDALNGKSDEQSRKEEERLARNMQEFMKMSEEGIDINLGTFSSLKKFPFFSLPANWFWPFDEHRREVSQLFQDNNGFMTRSLNALLRYSGYCNSDCYSLSLMLQQMPQQQRDLIFTQIAGKMEESGHTVEDIPHYRKLLPPARLYKRYFEDMYRFFKLHPQRKEFTDVFSLDPLFSNYPPLKELVWNTEYIREMGNFLMKLGYYKDAAVYWEEYIKTECVTAEVLCKLGYCYQKNKQPEKALLNYQQADLLEPDSKWLYNQLRLCYADLNLPDKEMECMLKLESMEPDNVKVLQETGLCMMQAGLFEEAANRFYKLEFMGEKVWAASRAIAWCLLKQHKTAQAEKYYARIIGNGKARWEDYLNAGHTAWTLGKTEDAVAFYRKYIELYNGNRKESGNALIPFYNDRKELLEWGIDENDIDLMGDIIFLES